MELLKRYLQAVKKSLPRDRRDDIASELEANLLAEIEEREAELGRSFTEDELADFLKQHGSPMLVASRFGAENRGLAFGRQLIGPELFPTYLTVMKIELWIFLFLFAMPLFGLITGRGFSLQPIAAAAAWMFGVPTLVFIGIEKFAKPAVCNSWDPRKLPTVERAGDRISYAESIPGLIFAVIALLWWTALPRSPFLVLGPMSYVFDLGDAFSRYYVPVLLLTVQLVGMRLWEIIQPRWSRVRDVLDILFSAAGYVMIYVFLHSQALVVPKAGVAPKFAEMAGSINRNIFWNDSSATFWGGIGIALFLYGCVPHFKRLTRHRPQTAASALVQR